MLRARNLGEADRIFTLLSSDRGKTDLVAKGVRRPKSALAGQLQFLTEVRVTCHRGRNLDIVTQAQTVRSHWQGLVDPGTFAAASLLAEIVDAFCEPDLAVPDVYELLVNAAAALAASEAPASLVPRFELRLLNALGLAPPDDACIRCLTSFNEHGAWLDVDAGGLSCERCGGARGEINHLEPLDIANFRAIGAARGGPIRPVAVATMRTARAIDELIAWHLGKRPKSRALLDPFPA